MRFNILIILIFTLTVSCQTSRKASQRNVPQSTLTEDERRTFYGHFYDALQLKEEGKWAEAYEKLLAAAAIDSINSGLLFEMAQVELRLNKPELALQHLKKAHLLEPKNWWYSTQLIGLHVAIKDYPAAIKIAQQLKKDYPGKEASYNVLIALYRQTNQIQKAIGIYQELEKITGVNERIVFDKLQLLLQSNQLKKALSEIDRLIAKYPYESKYKLLKGDILLEQGQALKALELYNWVLQNDPESPFVYLSLSEYYNRQGDQETAMNFTIMALKNPQLALDTKLEMLGQYIERLLKSDQKIENIESLFVLLIEHYPLEEAVHSYYAAYLQYIDRVDEAASVYESMLAINPSNSQTWINLMQVYFGKRDHEQAILIADRAIEAIEENLSFKYFKSISLQILERNEEALKLLKATVNEFTDKDNRNLRSDMFAQLGDLYQKIGDSEAAYQAYEESLKLNPENIHTLNNYAYYLSLEKRDLSKAEKMSAKTIEKEPRNSTYLDTYAWIFYQQGNYSLAKFYIERAINNLKDEQDPGVILDHYGDILWMNNEDEKALEAWKKALKSGLESEELIQKIENHGWDRTKKED